MARGGAKGGDGENTKKKPSAAAKKAEKQQNAEKQKSTAIEDQEWSKGAKSNSKKEAEEAKKAELLRKKQEKEALLAEEEKNARAAPKNTKSAPKKTVSKGLDLSQLDAPASTSKAAPALAATGIDNALDALSLTAQDGAKIDKHPERRFKAALAAYMERRMLEMDTDGSGVGLRKNQKEEKIRKEFEKSPENPFNQVNARYDATKDEVKELRAAEKNKIEGRLAEKN